MKTITLKLSDTIAKEIDTCLEKFHYTTKSEFIREAIRDKLKLFKQEVAWHKFKRFKGRATQHVSDEDARRIREELSEEIEDDLKKAFGIR